MLSVKLVKPSIEYKNSYIEMITEWKKVDADFTPFVLGEDTSDFPAMLKRFEGFTRGIGVKEGFVPHSTFWLVRDEKDVLGAINIRHVLNEYLSKVGGHIGYGVRPAERNRGYATEMLRLALPEAKKLGISRALISCDKANPASAHVILKNGGVFESEVLYEGEIVQRYWVEIG
ncbi:MAG: GNAT family N-acetyltransferase [Dehalococcoidales bacterium]|nr:GNAT family N-acetyltransferase [Dehalococcoidales bacterium]